MMGGGTYSSSAKMSRDVFKGVASYNTAVSSGLADDSYVSKSREEVFGQRGIHKTMNPAGVKIRESRDSDEHPNSVAIIIALDVTGSMGHIPHHIVQDGLPHIMETIIAKGIADPQVLFLAIGDHTCDDAPLQVGQFESSDELLDNWLTSVWLEGHGGGNEGESYHLAWYFAGNHTAIDCFEKRNQKGFLFTIGDEPCLNSIPGVAISDIMDNDLTQSLTAKELLEKAKEKYNVFHVNILEGYKGSQSHTKQTWEKLIRERLIHAQSYKDIAGIIATTIVQNIGGIDQLAESTKSDTAPAKEEEIL